MRSEFPPEGACVGVVLCLSLLYSYTVLKEAEDLRWGEGGEGDHSRIMQN